MDKTDSTPVPVTYHTSNLITYTRGQITLRGDHLVLESLKSKNGPVDKVIFNAKVSDLTFDESANRLAGAYTTFTYNDQQFVVRWGGKRKRELVKQLKLSGIKLGKTQHVGRIGITLLIIFILIIVAVIVFALASASKAR